MLINKRQKRKESRQELGKENFFALPGSSDIGRYLENVSFENVATADVARRLEVLPNASKQQTASKAKVNDERPNTYTHYSTAYTTHDWKCF